MSLGSDQGHCDGGLYRYKLLSCIETWNEEKCDADVGKCEVVKFLKSMRTNRDKYKHAKLTTV